MARLLIECFTRLGLDVEVASTLRAFLRHADNSAELSALQAEAQREVTRLSQQWHLDGAPALWFCYHPYYKSPDLIGPVLCQRFGIPYVTAEASYSNRRNVGVWESTQAHVLTLINNAAVNICLTARDEAGLKSAVPSAMVATLKPFIDVEDSYKENPTVPTVPTVPTASSEYSEANASVAVSRSIAPQLVTVAMMRRGDKLNSYRYLASSLERLLDIPWTLSIVGDGSAKKEVQQLFSRIPPDRITWHGELARLDILKALSESALYVWPGCGEAYGLAYLEAQASGLPVVAFEAGGVPEVVSDGFSGILTPEGDVAAFGDAIAHLLTHENDRLSMADNAKSHVHSGHSVDCAVITLRILLRNYAGLKI